MKTPKVDLELINIPCPHVQSLPPIGRVSITIMPPHLLGIKISDLVAQPPYRLNLIYIFFSAGGGARYSKPNRLPPPPQTELCVTGGISGTISTASVLRDPADRKTNRGYVMGGGPGGYSIYFNLNRARRFFI